MGQGRNGSGPHPRGGDKMHAETYAFIAILAATAASVIAQIVFL